MASGAASAQGGLSLTASATRLEYGDRITRFDETYSAFYARRLEGETALLPTDVTGYALGAAYTLGGERLRLRFGYEYGIAQTDARSRFETGAGDRVQTRAQDHVATMSLMLALLPRIEVGPVAGATFRTVRITSRAIHNDGTESLGGEYRLNGVYDGTAVSFEAGGEARLGLTRRLSIPARVTVPIGSPGGDLGIPLSDQDLRQGNDTFPRDWDRWLADPSGLDDGGALDPKDFSGLRVQVGLEVSL